MKVLKLFVLFDGGGVIYHPPSPPPPPPYEHNYDHVNLCVLFRDNSLMGGYIDTLYNISQFQDKVFS